MNYHYRIRMADTDAAGRIYFASACRIAHEGFESFMEAIGFPIADMIKHETFGLPVVHLEAAYHASLHLGDRIQIHVQVKKIGNRSITFQHQLINESGKTAITIAITHAVVSARTGKAITIPADFKKSLRERCV